MPATPDAGAEARSVTDERDATDAPSSYHIETWGCQMNAHDSEKLSGILEQDGYVRAESAERADVILLNTCSIREKAAEKVFSELGRLREIKDRRPDTVIGVCGCVAQQEGEQIFRRAPYVDLVVGPRATGSISATIRGLRDKRPEANRTVDTEYRSDSIDFPFQQIRRRNAASAKAFVTLIEGCNHRCTYCIVPTTRGREICREMSEVLAEVRGLVERGTLEIEFLGQTVNAYRDSAGNSLATLLEAVSRIDALKRVRFTTSHPAQMTERLMDAMAAGQPVISPYLHLPVQSGSSRVLQLMRRGYDREGYLDKIAALRRRIPQIALGTDVIVGFPGEEETDFDETISLLQEIEYDTVYSYTYSQRPGTAALQLPGEPDEATKYRRLISLQSLQHVIQERRNQRWVGREVEVLVEGPSKRDDRRWTGRTPESRVVHFEGPSAAGRLERVRVLGATAYSLKAAPIEAFA